MKMGKFGFFNQDQLPHFEIWYNLSMREILRQSSYLFLAQSLTRIIGFFYTIFLARNLGVGDFGLFSVGLAYFSIISSLADFGFNRFLIREVAKEQSRKWEIIWNILMLRLTLISVFFAIFSIILYLLDTDKMRVSIILLSSLAVLPQTIAVTFDGLFIALKKLQFSAISVFISSISTVVIGLLLLTKGFGLFGAINALILGQIIYVLILLYFVYRKHGLSLGIVTTSIIKKALLGSLPYGLLAVLGLLYFRIDTVMLSYMRGNFETGIYAAGYKFLEALIFIPNALTFALFPAFAKLHEENPKKIKSLLSKSIKLTFFLGLFVTISYFLILPFIIEIFLPKFIQSIGVIKILSLSIPFIFVYVPASTVLISTEKYLKQVILFSVIPLTFNVLFNLVFIPHYGFLAAAYITVASDIVSATVILFCIKKFVLKS